ncbi:adenosylcobalamin-dependent ribonucleoside-diphosphate reductase [Dehalogenimonas etheniformans]|uniref:Vitamin B12-dependent ribonucleotide reductase n=1 Tax=Dehalogenimonas etheniformans TaxID=1536648 RepID=A0A2P5P8R4_9CHLR|nr:adenosylcobalamin-dependent ribonucleoside-diphosphate reductase [Dehalogenimonas etheniformans]PPD58683.1 adenosylcobalamin-dependent ribonucleoside-diphosphate reductase [Dehalogenimonas etheniformans]QNT76547.1 adenosylcobalamin-dependent ribonucleoside-diphosphate reductase [Dehalogenimonas etheniformans]
MIILEEPQKSLYVNNRLLEKRYLRTDVLGETNETPDDMFRRIANIFSSAEEGQISRNSHVVNHDSYYNLLASLDFLPNSPTLLNAGTENGQLASCYVLPIDDSVNGIGDALKQTMLIHKSGGSTGFNLSSIRPAQDKVGGRDRVAGGPIGLLNLLSVTADYIKQGGVRRGCNTALLNLDHPDIVEFIGAKRDPGRLTNLYTTVSIKDNFMDRVTSGSELPLVNPRNGQTTATVSACDIFDLIVDQAWRTGDPGLTFIDTVNKNNPIPHLGKIEYMSGCGEEALLPFESCILGSINLVNMLKKELDGTFSIDWQHLSQTIPLSVRFLDTAIDLNHYPILQSELISRRTRKIGLGVMGFADMLIRLGVPYNSDKALGIAEAIMSFVQDIAHETSHKLALDRGPFPAYQGSVYEFEGITMRNASVTSIAPTGSISLIAGVSSGIEPLFGTVFVRNMLDGEKLLEVNPFFERVAREQGFFSFALLERLVSKNRLDQIEGVPDSVKKIFVTAHGVSPEWHVKIQAAFQKYTDNAVSKTVNFPREASRDDIAKVFALAYQQSLKGITVYRDQSRSEQPLCTGEEGIRLVHQRYEYRHECL